MIEVMMGLAILTVGAAGIVALQRFAVMGTLTSRHITNATNVSAGVIERMDSESGNWTDNTTSISNGVSAGTTGDPAAAGETMPWLALALNTPGAWVAPNFHAFEIDGTVRDATALTDNQSIAYCTHVRATFLGDPAAGGLGSLEGAESIRLEVRTFYSKIGRTVAPECRDWDGPTVDDLVTNNNPQSLVSPAGPARSRSEYGVIYTTTILRKTSA